MCTVEEYLDKMIKNKRYQDDIITQLQGLINRLSKPTCSVSKNFLQKTYNAYHLKTKKHCIGKTKRCQTFSVVSVTYMVEQTDVVSLVPSSLFRLCNF